MGRLWLALALLVALVSTATAKPACACRTEVILPKAGATGVPTNARFWRITPTTSTPDQRIQVYELAPHTTYELSSPHLSFTTADGPDGTPPAQPTIADATIRVPGVGDLTAGPVTALELAATFDADTAVVRIDIMHHGTKATLYTTPDRLAICDPGFAINDDAVRVTVTAIDLAGNSSAPVTVRGHSILDRDPAPSCEQRPYRCGLIIIPLVIGSWVGGTIVFVWILILIDLVRRRLRGRATREDLALPAAEALARSVRLGAVLQLAALGALVAIAWNHDAMLEPVILAAPVLVITAIVTARRFDATNRVLRLVSYDGATATVCRDDVRVIVGGKEGSVRAAPWRVRRAKRNSIPRARI